MDQATKVTGYSLFEDKRLVTYGVLEANNKNPIKRMKQMYILIKDTIKKYQPDYIAIEQTHFKRNYGTFQQLSQLQGMLMAQMFELDIGFTIVQPSAWKSYCGIKGRKREEQKVNTIQMVKEKFNLDVSSDEADSIGISLFALYEINKNNGGM